MRCWSATNSLRKKVLDLRSLRKIDHCGEINSTPGYESVVLHGGQITADLNERWPFGDGEVGVYFPLSTTVPLRSTHSLDVSMKTRGSTRLNEEGFVPPQCILPVRNGR